MKNDNEFGEKIELALTYILSISIIGTFVGIGLFAQTIAVFVVCLTLTLVSGGLLGCLRAGSSDDNSEKQNITNQQENNYKKSIQSSAIAQEPECCEPFFDHHDISRELLKLEEKIAVHLFYNDPDSAIKLSMDILEYVENEGYGSDKHFSIIRQLDLFYPRRYEFEDVNYHCMYLCDLDISEGDKTLQFLKTPVYFVTTTRMAIMLEQQGRIDDAIDVCNWAIERHLWDYRKNSFLDRKLRLLRKKEKSQSNPEYKF